MVQEFHPGEHYSQSVQIPNHRSEISISHWDQRNEGKDRLICALSLNIYMPNGGGSAGIVFYPSSQQLRDLAAKILISADELDAHADQIGVTPNQEMA